MVRYLFDEDFNRRIVRGVKRRLPEIDALTIYESGLSGAQDPEVIEYAADQQRVLVSHDHNTMVFYARDRLNQGKSMAGLLLVEQEYPIGAAIDELVLIAEASESEEWQGFITFLPL